MHKCFGLFAWNTRVSQKSLRRSRLLAAGLTAICAISVPGPLSAQNTWPSCSIGPAGTLCYPNQVAVGPGGTTQTWGYDLYVNALNPKVFVDSYASGGNASLFLQGRQTNGAAINQEFNVNGTGLLTITPQQTGTAALTVSQSGNVGIGTTNAGDKLTVRFGTDNNVGLGTNTYSGLFAHNDAWNAWGNLQLNNSMYLLGSSGNVGIGTTNPTAKLDVAGSVRAAGGIIFPDGTIQTTTQVNRYGVCVSSSAQPPSCPSTTCHGTPVSGPVQVCTTAGLPTNCSANGGATQQGIVMYGICCVCQ